MRVPESIGLGAVRFSLGRATSMEDLDNVLQLLRSRVLKARS
jgi:cysteine sulfinate desulfinase/cysteine desulfurase-like protein